MFDNKLKISKK